MLTIYRRHTKRCPHRAGGRKYRRCKCPIWADGFLVNQEMRQSLKIRDWEKAQSLVREWEATGNRATAAPQLVTIEDAWERFIRDAEARGLRSPTIYKYKLLRRQMEEFGRDLGLQFIREFDVEIARRFRASWSVHNLAALKKLEYLRAFFRFAFEGGWIAENPATAKKIKNPRVIARQTLPFSREEVASITAACDKYEDSYGRAGGTHARRLKALVLLLRYGGLRMQDAVTLSRDRLVAGKLLLYTAKTGTPVFCPLPAFAVMAMEAATRPNSKYFFWTGTSTPESAAGNWRRSLARLFTLAQVENGHPHRFRDTFAVELLLAGVPLERVSVLLGHQSGRITERHYAPWVRSRQEQLEADVRRAWEAETSLAESAKGTPEVREKETVVN